MLHLNNNPTQLNFKAPLGVKYLNARAIRPYQAYPKSAGWDLASPDEVTIEPHSRKAIGTGIAFSLPKDTFALILSRSGLALDHKIDVCAGKILFPFKPYHI